MVGTTNQYIRNMPHIIMHKGVEIRQYGTQPGESVYPLCFTDDLEQQNMCNSDGGNVVKMHDSLWDAKAYIDQHVKS